MAKKIKNINDQITSTLYYLDELVYKFGNKIYPHIFNTMLRIGEQLKKCGFQESIHKPNLFYKKNNEYIVYADMRGTLIVKIWHEPCPLFYVKPLKEDWPFWKRNRVWNIEMNLLQDFGILFRLSFHEEAEMNYLYEWIYEIPHDSRRAAFNMFYEDRGPDGYCRCCSKDFQSDGYHCSDECEKREWRRLLARGLNRAPRCRVCGIVLINSDLSQEIMDEFNVPTKEPLEHHVSYYPEKKIYVCSSCHYTIHNTDEYPELKPPPGDASEFYYR